MKKNLLNLRFEYFIVFLLIMASGNPILVSAGRLEIMFVLVFILCLIYRNIFGKIIHSQYLPIFSGLFFIIILIQVLEFNSFSFRTFAGFYIRIFLGFVIFLAIPSGPEKYIKCLYFICIISLLIFSLSEVLRISVGVDLKSYFSLFKFFDGTKNITHILFYNFDGDGAPHSNSGPFWEPGAFQGYILIAILLLSEYKNKILPKDYWTKLIIFILALLSTKSTTGYLLLPLALIPHFRFIINPRSISSRAVKILILIFIGILFIPKFLGVDFIEEKIIHQYKEAINEQPGYEINRFGTFLTDWKYISKNPLLGLSIFDKVNPVVNNSNRNKQGNGLSASLYKFGFIGFGLYFIFLIFSFRRFYGGKKIPIFMALLVILLSLNGEAFLNFPIYWGLIALPRS